MMPSFWIWSDALSQNQKHANKILEISRKKSKMLAAYIEKIEQQEVIKDRKDSGLLLRETRIPTPGVGEVLVKISNCYFSEVVENIPKMHVVFVTVIFWIVGVHIHG
jgi:hypothetical protein